MSALSVSDAVNAPTSDLFTAGWTTAKTNFANEPKVSDINLKAATEFGEKTGLNKSLQTRLTTDQSKQTVSGVTGEDSKHAPAGTTPNTGGGDTKDSLTLTQSVVRFGLLVLTGGVGVIAFLQMMPREMGLPAPTPAGLVGAGLKKMKGV